MKVKITIANYNNPSIIYKEYDDVTCVYPEDLEDIIFGVEFNNNISCDLKLCLYSYERKSFTFLVTNFKERTVKRYE